MTRVAQRPWARRLVVGMALVATAAAGFAQPAPEHGHRDGPPGRAMPLPPPQREAGPGRWYDAAHGHNHAYPAPGFVLRAPPPQSRMLFWGGVNYRFHEGVWYTPGPRGYVVVRPPYGVIVDDLPLWRTVLVVGGLTYLYVNGVYYRQMPQGYEVVPPPVEGAAPAPSEKTFVYPRNGQSAQQQATDEYECHRWAVSQSGFDPTAAATGQGPGADTVRRSDYQRARSACLEGRGYTVR